MTYNRYTVRVDSYPMNARRIRRLACMERGIAYGLRVGVAVLSFVMMLAAGIASTVMMVSRGSHMGGEAFVVPALLAAFYWGYRAGRKKKGGRKK